MFCSHAIGLNLSRDWKCDGSVLFEVNSSWADFALCFYLFAKNIWDSFHIKCNLIFVNRNSVIIDGIAE